MALSKEDDERFRALAKSHPLLPAVIIEIHDRLAQSGFVEEFAKYPPGSPERLMVALQALDVRSSAFIKLVDTIDLQELFITVLQEVARTAWVEFAAFPIEKANLDSPDTRRNWRAITDRTSHWEAEGFRRLIPTETAARTAGDQPRRGYRDPVRAWMKQKEILSVKAAARKLGVSESTLKSIMTNRGEIRYNDQTLAKVLEVIGYKG